ncbi:TonB-dependent receptor [Pseudozobellia sp. WGM2]|uniref:SusC/RagA family TonB-linked outer membrane protein n=1 Tax=Pseudozobellia sp. WGM2 TaxID=2787625 RepID=UPI001ADF2F72|nr:TonB-dependent receptor [Pseudozobellia sp. WGM2]
MQTYFNGRAPIIIMVAFCKQLVKLYLLLFCSLAFALGTKNGISQDANIAISSEKSVSVKQVFRIIHQQTGYKFIFSDKFLRNAPRVTLNKGTIKTKDLLNNCLSPLNLIYEFTDSETIVVQRNKLRPNKIKIAKKGVQLAITGIITDIDGTPLAGANIVEKGTTNGTQTDFDGKFLLNIENDKAILIVSYIGFTTKEIPVDGQNSIITVLEESAAGLDEVVIVGYGTQRKSDVTGAVASISGSELSETASSSLIGQAQGRLAGVDIVNNNGSPGSPTTIRIRGNRSINAGNEPLFVIDGVPTTQGIDDFNPSDVESLEVLKDASAVAIYGSRGANGVILITTKRGNKGKVNVGFNTYYGPKRPIENIKTMDSQQFMEYNRVARGLSKNDDSEDVQALGQGLVDSFQQGIDTDWLNLALKSGSQQEHQLSVSGGSEKLNYYVSGNYYKEEGILKNSDFDRLALRVNLDAQINDKTKIGVSLSTSESTRNIASSRPYNAALRYLPLVDPYDENGDILAFPNPSEGLLTSPLLDYAPNQYVNENRSFRFFSNVFGVFDITSDLQFRLNVGSDFTSERQGTFNGDLDGSTTRGSLSNARETSTTIENILTFDKNLDIHNINLVGLFSYQTSRTETSNLIGENIPIQKSLFYDLDSAERLIEIGSDLSDWSLLSYMARLNYRLKDKYLLTASARADGSSRLAEGNKWAVFPALSAGWILSKENFLNDSKISFLKIRLGYGEVGNTSIDPYQTLGGLDRTSYAFGNEGAFGFGQAEIANSELSWEISKTVNLGLDFGIFQNRISGSLELYDTKTKDLLLRRQIPTTSGFNSILTNVGSTRNRGWEFSLSANLANTDNFRWDVDMNISSNKEEITSLFNGAIDDVGNNWFIGQPINVFYDYKFDGIWQTNESSDAEQQGQLPGDIKIADVNGRDENGVLTKTADGATNSDDRTVLGSVVPDWSAGLNVKMNYKNLDFSVQINTRQGQMLQSLWHDLGGNQWEGRFANQNFNYWTPENPSNQIPIPRAGGAPLYPTAVRYFDGSFTKIRNISLGYTIPSLETWSMRIYISAVNPLVFSSYDTVDPESSTGVVGPSTPLSTSTYLFGLNIKL